MFIVRWVGRLVSLPLQWTGQLTGLFPSPLSAGLLWAAWRIGGDGAVAVMAIGQVQKHDSAEAALAKAQKWLTGRPACELAALAAMLAAEGDQPELAQELLQQARETGPDQLGLLEMAELSVVSHANDPEGLLQLAKAYAQRTDLAPLASRVVHTQLLWEDMLAERWPDVEQKARWLRDMADEPVAAVASWVLARRSGERDPLEAYLDGMQMAPPMLLYHQALGHIAAGAMEDVENTLASLAEVDSTLADQVRLQIARKEAVA